MISCTYVHDIMYVCTSGIGMTCTLGGLIQYQVQFMCSIIACLVYDQANIGGGGGGGAIAPPAPMVPTPMRTDIGILHPVHTKTQQIQHILVLKYRDMAHTYLRQSYNVPLSSSCHG